jgi:hypothetical protein
LARKEWTKEVASGGWEGMGMRRIIVRVGIYLYMIPGLHWASCNLLGQAVPPGMPGERPRHGPKHQTVLA